MGRLRWLKEGSFIQEGETPKGKGFTRWLQEGYYLYGNRIADFRFMATNLVGDLLAYHGFRLETARQSTNRCCG